MQNHTMPRSAIIPVLMYPDVPEAMRWLTKTFGFNVRWHAGNHRAQLAYGNGVIAITEIKKGLTPVPKNFHAVAMLVQVPDLASHYKTAVESGATILQEPADHPFGERQYSAIDLGGHTWTFSQSVEDVLPEKWGGVSVNLD